MRFEVTFHTTYTEEGTRIGRPTDVLNLPLGAVREGNPVRVERPDKLEYPAEMAAEINPDYIGIETWEYDVADGYAKDFREALRHCPYVVEYTELPEAA